MSKVVVIGAGYVGLANALLFAQSGFEVTIVEKNAFRATAIRKGQSYLSEQLIVDTLQKYHNLLHVKQFDEVIWDDIDMVLLCVPTNLNEQLGIFDTAILDDLLEKLVSVTRVVPLVIKSTVPIGYTQQQVDRLHAKNIIFSPEFLREGSALSDSLYPNRLVFGGEEQFCQQPMALYQMAILNKQAPVLMMHSTEAEMVKLFSNAYLAMRVAFFNELDSVAKEYAVDTQSVIKGMGYDVRIGRYYNNPSFGYGGYCLPKDTRQLVQQTKHLNLNVIQAIEKSNEERKQFIINDILSRNACTVGIYSLQMKQGADNIRESAIVDILNALKAFGKKVVIYDDNLSSETVKMLEVERFDDLDKFKATCELIVTNRWHHQLADVANKVYTRDVFGDS